MDFALTAEQELIRSSAREFCDREIVPFAREWDRAEEMDSSIVGKLAEVGWLGASLPEAYGGLGLDTVSYALIGEELGRADSSVRGIVSVSNGLVGKTVAKWGTEEQKHEWLPRLCTGEMLGCYALTEPGSGSDAAALATRAERDGSDWLLSGSKLFITLGTWAAFALVFARTGEPGPRGITCFLVRTDAPGFSAVPLKGKLGLRSQDTGELGPRGITCFLVRTDAPGFSAVPLKGKLGLRSQDTGELHLDGVRVPDRARLGEEGKGFRVAMSALDNGRISLAAGCVGLAQGCVDTCIAYTKERKQFGRPVASFQLVQEQLALMAVETEAARLLTWRAAALSDAGEPHTVESSYAKLYASETAVRAANAAVQVHGGYGYIDEYPVGKYLRDARVTTLYEGTSEVQKLIIGRALTGESAFA